MLETTDKWFGITYKEDVPSIKAEFRKLAECGYYSEKLLMTLRYGYDEIFWGDNIG